MNGKINEFTERFFFLTGHFKYMYRFLPFILLCFFTEKCFAQDRVATYILSPEELLARDVKMFTDNSGNLLADIVSYTGNSRVLFKEGELPKVVFKEQKSTDRSFLKTRSFERLATNYANGFLYDCYYSSKNDEVFFTALNTDGSFAIVTDTLSLNPQERIAGVFQDDEIFYVVTYIKDSDALSIHVKKNGKKIVSVEKVIAPGKIVSDKKNKVHLFSDFFKKDKNGSYIIYSNSYPVPAYLSLAKKKVYQFKDKLVFTIENPNYQTNLITVSLNDFTVEYNSVSPPPGFTSDKIFLPGNSLLNGDLLLKTGNYGDTFFIKATNIYTGKVLLNSTINSSSFDSVYVNPLLQTGNDDTLPAKRIKELARHFKSLTINVSKDSNFFDVGLSSYFENMTGWDIFLSVVTSVAATYAINSSPNSMGVSMTQFKHTGTLTINNSLDINTGKVIRNRNAKFAVDEWQERMKEADDFAKEFSYREDRPQMTAVGNNMYVSILDPQQGKLLIYKF